MLVSISHHVYETPCERVEYIIYGIVETHGGPRSPISRLIIKLITYDALAELEALECSRMRVFHLVAPYMNLLCHLILTFLLAFLEVFL